MVTPISPQEKPHLPTGQAGPARHVFSRIGIALFAVLIVGSFVVTAFYARTLIQSGQLAAVISSTLVDLANADRKQEELGTLTTNPLLTAAAQAKANDMAQKGYFAHHSPEGLTPWHWFELVGYSFTHAGENLAVNFSDSEDVERAWMNSPLHRANILNGTFTEIGIATAVGEYEGKKAVFVVQMFGTPRAAEAARVEAAPIEESTESADEIAVAAVPIGEAEVAAAQVSAVEYLATSPHTLLRTVYIISALFIIGALALVTRMEFAHHHFRHMAAASALLVLLCSLFYVADRMLFTEPTLAKTPASYGI